MKLSLPSTWTRERILILFLIAFLKIKGVNSRRIQRGFDYCLAEELREKNRSLLFGWSFSDFPYGDSRINSGETLTLFVAYEDSTFYCAKIGLNIFCSGANGKCGGLLGDGLTDIKDNYVIGDCSVDSSTIESYLENNIGNLTISKEWGYYYNYARWNCSGDNRCLSQAKNLNCNWDVGGWTCYDLTNLDRNEIYNDISKLCYLQWPTPFSKLRPSTMKINQSGLPTPWPIALISWIISLISIYTAQAERYELGWLAKASISWSIFRSSTALIGGLNSWQAGGGIYHFQYPELALLFSFPLVAIIFSLRNALEQLVNNLSVEEGLELQTMNNESQQVLMSEEVTTSEQEKLAKLKRIYWWLKSICGFLLVLSVGAHFFSMIIYHHINLDCNRNYPYYSSNYHDYAPISAQLITNCDEPGTSVSGACIKNDDINSILIGRCDEQNENTTTCYFLNKNVIYGDYCLRLTTTTLASFLLPFMIFEKSKFAVPFPPLLILLISIFMVPIFYVKIFLPILASLLSLPLFFHKKTAKKFREYSSRIVSALISLVSLSYLVVMIMAQSAPGLQLVGQDSHVESCDVNPNLLNSKTGYIQEWFTQRITPLKQLSFL